MKGKWHPPAPSPLKRKKEKEKKNPLPEPNLSLHSMKQSLHKLASLLGRFHGIAVPQKCTGSALFMPRCFRSLLTPSPLKWVYTWQHLCYLRNALAKNNPARRSRPFLHLPVEHRGACNPAEGFPVGINRLSYRAMESKQQLSWVWCARNSAPQKSGIESWEVGVAGRRNTMDEADLKGYATCWGEQGRRRNAPSYWKCVKTGSEVGTPLKRL